jgi:SAM-dependent methyltransferase
MRGSAADPADPVAADLGLAAANADAGKLLPGTRAAPVKRLVLRVLRVSTSRQALFNRAALRVLGSLDGAIRRRVETTRAGLSELASRWDRDLTGLRSRLEPLELRAGDVEEDIADLQQADRDRKRSTRELEERVRRLEARLTDFPDAPDRDGANGRSIFISSEPVVPVESADDLFAPGAYRDFEAHFRGPRAAIRERLSIYLPILRRAAAAGPDPCFADLGCGRGELLEVAAGAGLRARGFDRDASMVEVCRSHSLDVTRSDVLAALEGFPDASLAAIAAIQVVEHLPWAAIRQLIEKAHRTLRPGGCLILETINPASLYAWRSYYADPTHRQPVPEPTCRYLMERAGFRKIEAHFLHPVEDPALSAVLEREPSVKPLADYLFGCQDYALVGWRSQ